MMSYAPLQKYHRTADKKPMSPRPARRTPLAAVPVEPRGPRDLWLQAKLAVGASTDPLEREADAVAARVVRGDAPGALAASGALFAIQRACAECEEESLRRKGAQAESTAPVVDSAFQQAIAAERGGGSPLPQGVRDDIESRFGQNFDAVRIHRSPRAATLAADLNAQAFTVGQNIFFGQDRYQPHSPRGRELLAHDLTHTLQQRAHGRDGALRLKREVDDEALLRRAKVLRPLLKAWLKRAVRKELDTEHFPELRRRRAMMIRALVEHGLCGRELTEEEQQRLAVLEASAPASARPDAARRPHPRRRRPRRPHHRRQDRACGRGERPNGDNRGSPDIIANPVKQPARRPTTGHEAVRISGGRSNAH